MHFLMAKGYPMDKSQKHMEDYDVIEMKSDGLYNKNKHSFLQIFGLVAFIEQKEICKKSVCFYCITTSLWRTPVNHLTVCSLYLLCYMAAVLRLAHNYKDLKVAPTFQHHLPPKILFFSLDGDSVGPNLLHITSMK